MLSSFFCALVLFSNCRVEDKIRCKPYSVKSCVVLFEFFDSNENNYLEEIDIQFMFQSSINGLCKIFSFTDEQVQEDSMKH